MSRPLTDLERCRAEGISLTELRRRREATTRRMTDPAMREFRRELRKALGLPAEIPESAPEMRGRQP